MRADDEAQLQKVPKNFFHRLYVQTIFGTACLAVLLHQNLRCSYRSSLLAAIARALIDSRLGHVLCING